MDDPTGELRRQRELVAAHLRWLDEQIARTQGSPPPPAPPSPSTPPVSPHQPAPTPGPVAAATTSAASPTLAALPDITLPEIDPGSVRNEVRRGCFLYVAIASLLLFVSVALAIWIARSW